MKPEKKINKQCKRGSTSKRKQHTTGYRMFPRQEEFEEICQRSDIIDNLWAAQRTLPAKS